MALPRVGEKLATTVVVWVQDNKELLVQLEEKFKNTGVPQTKGVIVLTGRMPQPRTVIADILESKGWSVKESVTSKTDILLYGKNPGSKLDKARQLNVQTIEYQIDKSIANIL